VAGLAKSNLVHQGAELAYLLRHDPQFRGVPREHLREVGKRLRLKDDPHISAQVLRERLPARFHFCVISASPREVVQSALEGIVPAENLESLRKRSAFEAIVQRLARTGNKNNNRGSAV
jgi:hypothetical protein